MPSPACTPVPAAEHSPATLQADRTVVCRCLEITAPELVRAIRDRGLMTVREVGRCTGAGQGCTCCHEVIRQFLVKHAASS